MACLQFKKSLCLLVTLAATSFAAIQLTHTHGYNEESTQICTTTYATTSAKKAITTASSTVTWRANVVVILTRFTPIESFTPIETITPAPTTITETTNKYAETTTTLDALTKKFYSTSTELATVTKEETFILWETQTETILSTKTDLTTIPTPAKFRPVTDTSRHKNYTGQSANVLPGLELRGIRDRRPQNVIANHFPQYPAAVVCNDYIRPTWTELIGFAQQTMTTTAPRSFVTNTVTSTVTSTFTVAPSVSTTLTTTETIFTTDTVAVTASSTTTSTTSLFATVSAIAYAACDSANLLGPRLDNGQYIAGVDPKDYMMEGWLSDIYDASECCQLCQARGNSCMFSALVEDSYCWLLLFNNGQCHAGEVINRIAFSTNPNLRPEIFSNGPCGLLGSY